MSEQSVSESIRDKWVWFLILGIVLVVCGILLGLAMWRINQKYLNKEDKP